MRYKHTQKSSLIIIVIITATIILLLSIEESEILLSMVLIIISLILFYSLTVSIDDDFIEIRFGPGLIRKRFPLEMIQSCQKVKNPWYYGLGIRYIKGGWLFNVSGYDAIEIVMKNGRRYRIGTDEPEKLEAVIKNIID